MKRPWSVSYGGTASLAMSSEGDDMSSFSSASTHCLPGRRQRKQPRTMEDAFRSFSIGKEKAKGEEEVPSAFIDDAVKSAAVSNEEVINDESSTCSSLEDELLLTDQERAERKVMFELVFGKSHEDVVEAKLQEWIHRTALEATTKTIPGHSGMKWQDDFNVRSATIGGGHFDGNDHDRLGGNKRSWFRNRSNSLPKDLASFCADASADYEGMAAMEDNYTIQDDGMELSL